jgi:hypothetical protein
MAAEYTQIREIILFSGNRMVRDVTRSLTPNAIANVHGCNKYPTHSPVIVEN